MRESLSNNHFSHEDQLTDVLNWLQSNQPSTFKAFITEFPEWEYEKGDKELIQEKYDVEWFSWATDWVEAATDVYWEDGEPWLEKKTYVDDRLEVRP
jgi:hypothetical protein